MSEHAILAVIAAAGIASDIAGKLILARQLRALRHELRADFREFRRELRREPRRAIRLLVTPPGADSANA